MKHSDFAIGTEFRTATGKWRCTDVGTRTIAAIKIDPVEICRADIQAGTEEWQVLSQAEAEAQNWFSGPPYGVAEIVFDEDDIEGCEPA